MRLFLFRHHRGGCPAGAWELRAHLAEFPDYLEALKELISNLSLNISDQAEAYEPRVGDRQEEIRALYHRWRRLEPSNHEAWCDDLDTPETLEQARRLVAEDPSHWLVTKCLAVHLGSDSEAEAREASRMLDRYLARRGLAALAADPGYILEDDIGNAILEKGMLAEDVGPESLAELVELAESTGNPSLLFQVASAAVYFVDESSDVARWARDTYLALIEEDLKAWQAYDLCDWFVGDDQVEIGRKCFERLLVRSEDADEVRTAEAVAEWRNAAVRARDKLNRLDVSDGLLASAVFRIEQAPSFGRLHLWRTVVWQTQHAEDTEASDACTYLGNSWYGGVFEDEVLSDPARCPARLEILVDLMRDCGLEHLLEERTEATPAE